MALSAEHVVHQDRDEDAKRARRREWNRTPLADLFPRIPAAALERVLDLCINVGFTYNTSQGRLWNARRYSSIVVAHVRHFYTDYDRLLKVEHEERFAARKKTAAKVWKILRGWCPWDEANEVLERCFNATLLQPERRDAEWDAMDIDDESFYVTNDSSQATSLAQFHDFDDPMDLD